ncbi:MAG: hypothetical protein LBC98_04605 [Prevotellaceae bacterium]|nr:hypothetical protein [Prevotellaceae bacterium]
MKKIINRKSLFPILVALGLLACKTEPEPEKKTIAPSVVLNTATGEYLVKTGESVELLAIVENVVNPIFSWKLDGKLVSDRTDYRFHSSRAGEHFIVFRVDDSNGSVEQQAKITVSDKLPPKITAPAASLIAYVGVDTELTVEAENAEADATYVWRLNGEVVSETKSYVFRSEVNDTYAMTVRITTADGADMRTVSITVIPEPEPELFFDNGRYRAASNIAELRQMTVPIGKNLVLAPVVCNIKNPVGFRWTVDEVVQNATGEFFNFTPSAKGDYHISVTETGTGKTAELKVTCTEAEGTFFRAKTSSGRAYANKVYDYIPAPGQFVDFQIGSTYSAALAAMQVKVDGGDALWHIGAMGGYWIVGFDHSIANVENRADFVVNGNAFPGWCEPGIVWVMQDENGNGLPDDTWYELKGSETGKAETKQRYAITYFKPRTIRTNTLWTDNIGGMGSVDWLGAHGQSYYFPMFIADDSYTLVGTCLTSTFGISGGLEVSKCYDWGYVDNGSSVDSRPGGLFWIEDAIQADGSPANLTHIDFVKVHTATTGKGAAVGEISTEPGCPSDYNFDW